MYLKKLVKTNKTVFTITDLQQLFDLDDKNYTRVVISRMVKKGELKRVYSGIYAYGAKYDYWELANRIKTPSYVSLESVLVKSGIIFQDYGQMIFSVSDNTVVKTISDREFHYQQIKNEILSNPIGVEFGQVMQASPERAICDRLYLTPGYYFDNLESINKSKLIDLAKIYNKRVYQEVENLC
ncbi:hypothetical protein KKE34_02020 [Patescibacteria group bacterium]|nr:hypothetical protein [Patescibacteria group bacterium]MBU1885362.1 hypothetical protein [Patescibacteria group bacterium]